MKKVVLFAAAAVLGFSACQKTESAADNNLPVKQKLNDKLVVKDGEDWGLHNTWIEGTPDCIPTPKDCFDEIVVTAPAPNVFTHFIGEAAKSDYKSVFAFARENSKSLGEFMEEADVIGLIEGRLYPSIRENKEGKIFLLLKQGGIDGELLHVYQYVVN